MNDILRAMKWEDRLAKARARRAEVLAAKTTPEPVVPAAAPRSADMSSYLSDEREVRGTERRLRLVNPVAGGDPAVRAGAKVVPLVLHSSPAAPDRAAAVEAPADPAPRRTRAVVFSAGIGLGLGIALGLGLVMLFLQPDRLVVPPTPGLAVAPSAPSTDPAVRVEASGPLDAAPAISMLSPVDPSPGRPAVLPQPSASGGAILSDASMTAGPGPKVPVEGFAMPLTAAALAPPDGAGFRMPPNLLEPDKALAVVSLSAAVGPDALPRAPSPSSDGRIFILAATGLADPSAPLSEANVGIATPAAWSSPLRTSLPPVPSAAPAESALAVPDAPDPPEAVLPPGTSEVSGDLLDRLIVHVFAPAGTPDDTVDETVAALRDIGLGVGQPQPSPFSIRSNNVRYYHPEDAEPARLLAEAIGGPARDFTSFRPSPPEGTVEIWLAGQAADRPRTTTVSPLLLLRNRLIQSLRQGRFQ